MLKLYILWLFTLYPCIVLGAEFQSLFNGSSLEGWEGNPKIWKVKDGVISAEIQDGQVLKKNEFLFYSKEVSDFELMLDYRIEGPRANSGIQIRSSRNKHGHAAGYQADLDGGKIWLGRIYDEHGRGLLLERGTVTMLGVQGEKEVIKFRDPQSFTQVPKINDWNQYRIIAKGNRLEIYINGVHFSTLEDYQKEEADLKGLIALQLHSGKGPAKLEFRNIQLKEIDLENSENVASYPKKEVRSPLFYHLKQNPVADQDGMSNFKVPEGFKVENLVKEPDLKQPIAMAFDAKGRIWIAEAMNYPTKAPKGQGKDRLLIFSDEDANGSFETRKVFAENLNLVSGFEIGYGGVWVGAAPELLFIPDRNRDDKPDGPAKVILDGWDTRDTHETPNSFLWGHDGWLYGNHGVFNNSYVGKPGTPKEKRTLVHAAVWRYHPIRDVFEVFSEGGSNQWGLDYNATGELFMTHCRSSWGKGPVSQLIRDGYYWNQNNQHLRDDVATAKKGWSRTKETPLINFLNGIAANGHGQGGAGKPNSRKIFGGHSHVGVMFYLGDNWPDPYRHQLYAHNLHGSQMNRLMLKPFDSANLAYTHGRDQLFVEDEKYLAVDLKYGPDGAVYFIDWHDKQHCHSRNFEIWDRSNGRLNRMQWQATYQPYQHRDLFELSEKELIDLLTHKNEWFSRMAQHVMRQKALQQPFSQESLQRLESNLLETENPNRFRYLVALYGLEDLSDVLYHTLLKDSNEHIRAQALYYLTERPSDQFKAFIPTFLQMAENDTSAKVRLALSSIIQKRVEGNKKQMIEILALRHEDANDRFIPKMLWFAYAPFARQNLDEALLLAKKTKMPMLRDSIRWFVAKYNLNKLLVDTLEIKDQVELAKTLDVANQALGDQINMSKPTAWDQFVSRYSKHKALGPKLKNLESHWNKAQKKDNPVSKTIIEGKEGFAICAACHMPGKNLPGPSLEEIAKVYNNKKDLLAWIKKPGKKRENYMQMPAFDMLDDDSLNAIAEYLLAIKMTP